jgi:hypothetical protein
MLLTEDEAKTKECRVGGMHPMVPPVPWIGRVGHIDDAQIEKLVRSTAPVGIVTVTPHEETFVAPLSIFPACAASGCMHWRWGDPLHEQVPVGNEDPRLPPRPPEGSGWARETAAYGGAVWRRVKAQRGYCGLAGRP